MAQPSPYNRQFNFQNQQALTPSEPLPGDELDSELNAIKLTLDQLLANVELIQRDDGALANESVARVTLHSDVDLGFGAPSVWAHNTNYKADFDTIFHESFFYKTAVTHLSDPSPLGFATDLALGYWTLIADFSAAAIMGLGTMSTQNADLVNITGGSIAGTTVTVATPDADTKAANKKFVDDAIATLTAYVDAQVSALNTTLNGKLSAAAGTRLVFHQTAAPVGWTKSTTHDDKALRVVSGTVGSGGVHPFSTIFSKTSTDSLTLGSSHMPAHNHGGGTQANGVDHTHDFTAGFSSGGGAAGGSGGLCGNSTSTTGTSSGFSHTHGITSQGGDAGHSHGMSIQVQYADVIIAQKD